jgi:hypothetical protein
MTSNSDEARFYVKAAKNSLPRRTLDAIEALKRLHEEEPFRIVFHVNDVDDSMLLHCDTVSTTASLLKVESIGRLMLMIEKHPTARIQRALEQLAEHPLEWRRYRDEEQGQGATDRLPTIPVGRWEAHVDEIIKTLRRIARSANPAAPVRPTIRKKR